MATSYRALAETGGLAGWRVMWEYGEPMILICPVKIDPGEAFADTYVVMAMCWKSRRVDQNVIPIKLGATECKI